METIEIFKIVVAIITVLYVLGHLVHWNIKFGLERFLNFGPLKKPIGSLYTKNQKKLYIVIYCLLMMTLAWFTIETSAKVLFIILGIFPMLTVYLLASVEFILLMIVAIVIMPLAYIYKGILFLFDLPVPKWLD